MAGRFFCKIKRSLFIVLLLSVAHFTISCKRKNPAAEEIVKTESSAENSGEENLYDFYSPEADDASWVEALLVKVEEERIAEELARMEESLSEYQLEEPAEEELTSEGEESAERSEEKAEEINPIEKFFEEAREGKVLTAKNSQLSFYEFDNEILSPQYTEDGYIIVHANKEDVVRNFYDLKFQLVKKEEWKIKSAEDSKKLVTENFTYYQDSGKLKEKKITREDSCEKLFYNEAGYPLESKKYALAQEKQHILLERKWSYDEENRVLSDEEKEYNYKDKDYKKLSYTFTRSYSYSYKKGDLPPDFTYFENGLLKKKNTYSAVKGNYVSWTYFDENLSVKTYYEDDIRIRDEFYNSGKLFRTKLYNRIEAEGEKSIIQKDTEE